MVEKELVKEGWASWKLLPKQRHKTWTGMGGRQHNGLYTHPSAVATNGDDDDDDDDEQVDLPCFVKTIPWQQ